MPGPLTLEHLRRLTDALDPAKYRCPADCGDTVWHPFYPPALVARYVELGGELSNLGKFCEFPTAAHRARMNERESDLVAAFHRLFEET